MSLEKLHPWEKSVWQWRSGGLAVYEAGIVGVAGAFCASVIFTSQLSIRRALSALFDLRNVGLLLVVWALHFGLMSVHTALVKSCSPMPPAVAYLKPFQRWKRPVAQLSAAVGSLPAIQSTLIHLLSSAAVSWASVWCFMVLLHGKGLGAWGMWYGIALGVLHGLLVITRGEDVLRFPIIHRQRLFRVKMELLQIQGLIDAGILAVASLAAAGLAQGLFRFRMEFPGVCAVAAALLSGALTAFCMRMGRAIANIVTTEHLRFAAAGDADPNALLFATLQDKKRPVWQALALQDLTHLSQGGPSEKWRRAAIFDDESGESWSTTVQHCLGEVEEMAGRTAAGLPQVSRPADKKAASTPAWNIHSASTKAFGGGNRAQEEALAYQRSRCWHAVQSIRALGGLCMASHTEDRLGTAQLAQPNLGTVTAVLASTVLAMQAFSRTSGASGKGSNLELAQSQSSQSGGDRQAEVPAFALQDAALTALYGLVGTFGRDLEPLVRGSSHKLPYGSASEAALLLARCSALQE